MKQAHATILPPELRKDVRVTMDRLGGQPFRREVYSTVGGRPIE